MKKVDSLVLCHNLSSKELQYKNYYVNLTVVQRIKKEFSEITISLFILTGCLF